MTLTERAEALAARWSWRIHGIGLSTSVGVHTRRLIAQAFAAGYKAGRRDARRSAAATK
jgi:hypothetical protein